ncbi:hypothetical protein [Pseudomonas sp. MPC6]|uniref:hypothetical protein n=1 Tax=unclassified Pseudomonas TaxID=196821 RepID=UPI00111013D1|nr:hypothetical protein [Pseudomonas sp. MPC6]QCY10142.1 hypothetical protein ELQ88_04675 [Pseudomonas sp. MPC6]
MTTEPTTTSATHQFTLEQTIPYAEIGDIYHLPQGSGYCVTDKSFKARVGTAAVPEHINAKITLTHTNHPTIQLESPIESRHVIGRAQIKAGDLFHFHNIPFTNNQSQYIYNEDKGYSAWLSPRLSKGQSDLSNTKPERDPHEFDPVNFLDNNETVTHAYIGDLIDIPRPDGQRAVVVSKRLINYNQGWRFEVFARYPNEFSLQMATQASDSKEFFRYVKKGELLSAGDTSQYKIAHKEFVINPDTSLYAVVIHYEFS